ncbi:hypothetical protein DFH08DRAFT_803286 [Mycena albidolilacea]|uniref:Uncharacterized protein n=1 Tax=Mycena albidolilacea TaxID=1033008 RepID=A0AAD7ACL3_9AGAR|nr:hypothetical protein DFH08DRAFT_803286 [Mycena albidolilacea]
MDTASRQIYPIWNSEICGDAPLLNLSLDLHIEAILMCLAQLQLSTTFPPTLRRHNCLVHPSGFLNSNAFEWRRIQRIYHVLSKAVCIPSTSFPSSTPCAVARTSRRASSSTLKVADPDARARIVDAIRTRGREMMMHSSGHWAVQRCLEVATGPEERHKIVACMRNVAFLTHSPPYTNADRFAQRPYGRPLQECHGCHLLQTALDCEGQEVSYGLLIMSELLWDDPATTPVNKYVSHVWNRGALVNPTGTTDLRVVRHTSPHRADSNPPSRLESTSPSVALACHETGSLLVQRGFENFEESVKDGTGTWHRESEKHSQMALENLLSGPRVYHE